MDRTHDMSMPPSGAHLSGRELGDTAAEGLRPLVAVSLALWYGLTAAAAMQNGFRYLHEGSETSYAAVNDLMTAAGIGIGVALAVFLARGPRWIVGIISSSILSVGYFSLIHFIPADMPSPITLFGFMPSILQFFVGIAVLMLLSGLIGTALGVRVKADAEFPALLLGVRHRHWLWLWLAVYAWVALLPTGIYYIWLEVISSGYVLVHPSLWFSEAWIEGWTLTFGFAGVVALLYGIELSLRNVSTGAPASLPIRKRILLFLLGTLILAGPLSNVLFRIAIHQLKHLPDGISANPWWVLR